MPDFSEVDSLEKAQALCDAGKLDAKKHIDSMVQDLVPGAVRARSGMILPVQHYSRDFEAGSMACQRMWLASRSGRA
jgi:hypothetical protein